MRQSRPSRTLISLGANLGNAKQTIENAKEAMVDQFGRQQLRFSRLYKTAAVGGPVGQEDFYNAVAAIESDKSAFEIWQFLHKTEQTLGRHRLKRWEARRIDLDVLLHESQSDSHATFKSERIWTPTFKVPHPRMSMRTFVLTPACDIAADWIEPVTGQSLEMLSTRLDRLSLTSQMPRLLLTCESEATLDSLVKSLGRADPSFGISKESQPIVFRNDHTWIVTCLLPTIQAASADGYSFQSTRATIIDRLLGLQSSRSTHFFDHWMHICRSPDPSISHWEDYCRPWAEVLGMIDQDSDTMSVVTHDFDPVKNTPPYLLAADDLDWAAHELIAATDAMTCPIQPCGAL